VVSRSVQQNLECWQRNADIRISPIGRNVSGIPKSSISPTSASSDWHPHLACERTKSECEWDNHRAEYEDLIHLADAIVSDRVHLLNKLSCTLSLDSGLIFSPHAVACKYR
jgi:hypothetical protein